METASREAWSAPCRPLGAPVHFDVNDGSTRLSAQRLDGADTRDAFDGREEALLGLFAERPESQQRAAIEQLLTDAPDWLTLYHLSPQRRVLLSWLDFDPKSTVLEVGAGCGALTGLLCERARQVVANEHYAARAEVIDRRHADRPNLRVIAGPLELIELEEPVDDLVCVGVWEYAGIFMPREGDEAFVEPFLEFLALLHGFLRPGGRLVLAIENRLGLEYLAGAEEDHLDHGPLAGVEGYVDYQGVRTFSRREVADLLAAAGFREVEFFFPWPDYKLPELILADGAAGSLGLTAGALGALIPSHRARLGVLNEQLLAAALLREGLIESFANSFLVVARS